jgi:hypothetical protein
LLAVDGGSRAFGGPPDPAAAARMRLFVAAVAVCPAMSLLGAKRPQHGVWQLIVAALAVVITMPALSAWLVRPGSLPDMHLLGRGFLVVLAAVGWMNFLATRSGLAATLITAGQLAVMRPFLPGVTTDTALPQDGIDCVAAGLIAAGALLAWGADALRIPGTSNTRQRPGTLAAVIDRPFLALRETLGAAWTLRIAERFDTVAAARGWPCRLSFQGAAIGGKERRQHIAKQSHLILQYPGNVALKAHGKSIVVDHQFPMNLFKRLGIILNFAFDAFANELGVQAIQHY